MRLSMCRIIELVAMSCVVALLGLTSTKAAVTVTVVEDGNNVVFTTTGSLSIIGLPPPGSASGLTGAVSAAGSVLQFPTSASTVAMSTFSSGLESSLPAFGTGGTFNPSSSSGTGWGVLGTTLFVPSDLDLLDDLQATMTFNGQSFTSMGLASGTYMATLLNTDTITLEIGTTLPPEVIPIPAALPLLATCLVGLAAVRHWRRA